MARWVAAVLTVAALAIGGWGIVRWRQTQPPAVGDIALESVTPPGAALRIHTETWCDKAVEGYWAIGDTSMAPSEVHRWYAERFGPIHEEASARLNARVGLEGSYNVYEDIRTWIGGSRLMVWTYDTLAHECLEQAREPWDLRNASSRNGLCVETNLLFWGVEYGKGEAAEPPTQTPILEFDGGRAIAHGMENLDIIYARESAADGWHRYVAGTDCAID